MLNGLQNGEGNKKRINSYYEDKCLQGKSNSYCIFYHINVEIYYDY